MFVTDNLASVDPDISSRGTVGRGLHSFPLPLNFSLPRPFSLNLSSLCPPYNPKQPLYVSRRCSS